MGRQVGLTNELCVKREFSYPLYFNEAEKQKLERTAYLQGMTKADFIRQALEHEYKRILDEEVRQYEHSGMHSEIHKGAREPDINRSERSWTDRDGGCDGKAGSEGRTGTSA